MERFVDIHTHILYGLDDGARDEEQAIALLRMAWEDGTGAVVLTPHYRGHYRRNTGEKVRAQFDSLRQRAAKELPELELYLGNEVSLEVELEKKLEQGQVLSLNGGDYVLLEFRESASPRQVLEGTLKLLNCGYTPIVAHAERYEAFQGHRTLADEVIGLGGMIQINAGSLFGENGLAPWLCCKRLLRKKKVHFVASDAHDTQKRTPMLGKCYRLISRKYGTDYARRLFWRNAREIL